MHFSKVQYLLNNRITYFFILLLLTGVISLFFPRCANIIPPTGGPRDTIPPEVIRSDPANFSTRFKGSEITIEFDELIQLRNINQQFIITPPQEERPDFIVRGDILRINLNTDLIPNTTYTLNFGDAIVDNNEGNILSNYEFVFSTGDIIDSLSYSGVVLNAFDNKPVEGVVVMLYDKLHDSIPYLQIPLYANRTNEEGHFQLNNLRADTFKVFALDDENNNYLYDRPGEEAIAFLDDYIFPDTLIQEMPAKVPSSSDTLNDTPITRPETGIPDAPDGQIPDLKTPDQEALNQEAPDGVSSGSENEIVSQKPVINFHSGDTLYLFREETGRQYISRNERNQRGELLFVFNRTLKKEWSIEPVDFEPSENWKLVEKNPAMDSIRFWITDQETRNLDNMRYLVSYWATGPSDSLKQIRDSLNMNYTPPSRTRREAALEEDDDPAMEVNFGITAGGNQELHKDLKMSFPVPLDSIDFSKITLSTNNNNIVPRTFELIQDSLRIRNYNLVSDWVPGENYSFVAIPGAFNDIFGLASDSIDFAFTTRENDHYGRILLDITGIDNHKTIQLLDENDLVLREFYIDEDGELIIDYLQPQDYKLKLISDTNKNKKWDTGNYLEGIQPERVKFFRDLITVRSNWDIEIEWDLDE